MSISSLSFENTACAHACANTHGNNAKFAIDSFKLVEHSDNHTSTGGTEWMANSNTTTSLIQLLIRDAELLDTVSRLTGKRLIHFPDVNLWNAEAGLLQGFWDHNSRSNTHDFGWGASDCVADKSALDWKPKPLSHRAFSQQHNCGSIGDLTRITRRSRPTLLKSWLELAKRLHCGLWSDTIIFIHNHLLFLIIFPFDDRLVWGDLRLRPSHLIRISSLPMTLIRHLILLLASNTVFGSYVLRCDAHWNKTFLSLLMIKNLLGKILSIDLAHHVVV